MGYNKIGNEFLSKLINLKDDIAIVATTHLYIENLIDKIIDAKAKNPKRIQHWNFSNKLEFIYNLNLISANSYEDIKKFNQLRNNYAHELNYTIEDKYLNFNIVNIMSINNMNSFNTIEEKLAMICALVYGSLHNHCIEFIGGVSI